ENAEFPATGGKYPRARPRSHVRQFAYWENRSQALRFSRAYPRRRARRRFTISTSTRYMSIAMTRKTKYARGGIAKPRVGASGVAGRTNPKTTTAIVVTVRGTLGRLLKGFPIVLITNNTRVCVASDSTN